MRDPAPPLLEIRDVSYAYGRNEVLSEVDLVVDRGEFVALVGPNGAGKSTLVRILLGLIEPTTGSARLFGLPSDRVTDRWRIGYVPQRAVLASDAPSTVEEIVAAGRLGRRGWWRPLTKSDRTEIRHAIASVGLEQMADRPVAELSGGQQQRAFIARAFASEPQLLILDEPIAGVDAESQRRLRDSIVHLVEDHGAGVLLVSHELASVAHDLDRVVVLKRSVQFDGPPSELTGAGVSMGVHAEDLPLWLERLG